MEAGRKGGRPLWAAAGRALTAEESRESREDSHTKIGRTHSQNQEELWKTFSKTVADQESTTMQTYLILFGALCVHAYTFYKFL